MISLLVFVLLGQGLPVPTPIPTDFMISDSIGMVNSTSFVFVDLTPGAGSNTAWDFGDGTTGQGRQTSHLYKKTGKFTIKMKSGGKEYSRNDCIEILDFPGISFTEDRETAPFNTDIVFTDTTPSENNSRMSIKSSYWDFGDGQSTIGSVVKHQYPFPKEYEVKLTKVYKITLSNSVDTYKSVETTNIIRITGVAIFVDAANTSTNQDGLCWKNAFSDLKTAFNTAAYDGSSMIFVSMSPIELSVTVQDEEAMRVPKDIYVAGGFNVDDPSTSLGAGGIPASRFSGVYTPIRVKGSASSYRSLKYVVDLQGNMSGFDIQMKNESSAIGGVKMNRDSSIINSKISVMADTGSTKSFFGIDVSGTTHVLIDGVLFKGVKGFGPSGSAIHITNSSNIIASRINIIDNSMGDINDGSLVSMSNGRGVIFSELEARRNDLGTKPGVINMMTDNGSDIRDQVIFNHCVFASNRAGNGSAIYLDRNGQHGTVVTIARCLFMNNTATGNESRGGAIFVRSGRVFLENSLLFGNQALMGNAVYFAGDTMRITQCTLANVGQSKVGADIRTDQKGLHIDNSIMYSEGPFLIKESSVAAQPDVFSCVVFPNPLGYGEKCTVKNPSFVNAAIFDFRLSDKSPCIGSSLNGKEYPYFSFLKSTSTDKFYEGTSDIRGVSREKSDIGAFEYTKNDPGLFSKASVQQNGMNKQEAEVLKRMIDDLDSKANSGGTSGVPMKVTDELRNEVSEALRASQ